METKLGDEPTVEPMVEPEVEPAVTDVPSVSTELPTTTTIKTIVPKAPPVSEFLSTASPPTTAGTASVLPPAPSPPSPENLPPVDDESDR